MPGGVAGNTARDIPELNLEVFKTGFLRRIGIYSAAGVRLAVEREVVFEDECGDGSGVQRIRLNVHRDGGLPWCDRSSTHGVAARWNGLASSGLRRRAIAGHTRIGHIAGVKGIGSIPRQHRDVVVRRAPELIRRRQINLRRQSGRQRSESRRAVAVAVAGSDHVLSAAGIIDSLSAFAALRTRTTRCDYRHVAGVQIGAKSRNRSGRATRWLGSPGTVLLASRVNLESEILLNDPLVVGDLRRRSLRVLHCYIDTAPGMEG